MLILRSPTFKAMNCGTVRRDLSLGIFVVSHKLIGPEVPALRTAICRLARMRYSTVHCDGVIRGLQRPPSSHHAPRDELLAEMLKTPKRKSQRLELGRANDTAEQSSAPTRQSQLIAAYQTLFLSLTGSLLLWGAFPPLNLPWLAWLAPVPWLYLAQRPTLAGWRPYFVLWFCGTVHWLLMLQGIRLAHPALYAGWIALSGYLGVYLPVFIGLTRVAIHSVRLPLAIAAPVSWVGLE